MRRALYNCLWLGHKDTAVALLQAKVAPCPTLFKDFPPLHLAAARGNLEACKLLLAHDSKALARRNLLLQTALHHAAAAGIHTSVRLLRELGAKAHQARDLHGNFMRNYASRWRDECPAGPGAAVWADLVAAAVEEIEAAP
jgi:ankyrin repeat protein